jgi:hypothetical protein
MSRVYLCVVTLLIFTVVVWVKPSHSRSSKTKNKGKSEVSKFSVFGWPLDILSAILSNDDWSCFMYVVRDCAAYFDTALTTQLEEPQSIKETNF